MKRKQTYVGLVINYNGELLRYLFNAETLKDAIGEVEKTSKAEDINNEEVNLKLDLGEKKVDVPFKISDLRKIIKQSELMIDFVPKNLKYFLVDLTQRYAKKMIAPIVGREDEIERVWFYLSQKVRNNVFIIGDPDVGKTAIAKEIARQITTNECPKEFYKKRVLMLRPDVLMKIENKTIYKYYLEKVVNFLVENKKEIVLLVDKAIYMKTDIDMISCLYAIIKKYNIPTIMTSYIEDYEEYFYGDFNISKYLNMVVVKEPKEDEILPMLESHIETFKKRYKVDITEDIITFAIYTACLLEYSVSSNPGYTNLVSGNPGIVINILEKAFMQAKRKGEKFVDKDSILSCYNHDLKEFKNLPKDTIRSTAYHEAGHYMTQVFSEHTKDWKILCVSIVPGLWWSGITCHEVDYREYAVHSRDYFIDRIAALLGGRVAEQKFTGLYSTGASSDLEKANNTARAMIMNWGFSQSAENKNRQFDFDTYFLIPESKKEAIDKDVEEIIKEATKRAEAIINEKEDLLKIIAERLIKDEVLTGKQLEEICKEYEATKENNKIE